LKICVALQAFFFYASSGLTAPFRLGHLFPALVLAGGIAALVGLWRLRRWAVYVLVALLALYFATHVGLLLAAFRGVLLGIVLRSVALAAGLAHWKKLG
jgi:hypothetical protein